MCVGMVFFSLFSSRLIASVSNSHFPKAVCELKMQLSFKFSASLNFPMHFSILELCKDVRKNAHLWEDVQKIALSWGKLLEDLCIIGVMQIKMQMNFC